MTNTKSLSISLSPAGVLIITERSRISTSAQLKKAAVLQVLEWNRSSRRLEFADALLSVHSPFDRAMSVAPPAAERPFVLYVCDGRAVHRRHLRIDDMPALNFPRRALFAAT